MTQLQMAGLARCSTMAARYADQGKVTNLRLSILIRIAAVLDCGLADLFPVLGAVRVEGDIDEIAHSGADRAA